MAQLTGRPQTPVATTFGASRPADGRRALRLALWAAVVATVAVVSLDIVITSRRANDARAAIRDRMAPYAGALRGAVERRIGLLGGFRSFIESRPNVASLEEEFPIFARGSLTAASGVRAIQYVGGGRIQAIWPETEEHGALGYDFTTDPRRAVRDDYQRSLARPGVTVTGPIPLIEGGVGIVLRERLADRPGFPQIAAIVLDVKALGDEAGIPDQRSGLRLELRNRDMRWFGGDAEGSAVQPESIAVSVQDGNWFLLGAPADGWASMAGADRTGMRLASVLVIAMAWMVGFVTGGREDRLAREVSERGARLDLALRAGGMGVFEWDVESGRVRWSESAARIFGFGADGAPQHVSRWLEWMHPEDVDGVSVALREAAEGVREGYVAECRVRQRDGTYRWMLVIGELERDAAGRPRGVMGIVSDATERRGLEERLRHAQRLESVGKLAGGVAHDFNNLLTAIAGFAELARDRAATLDDAEAAADIGQDLEQLLQAAQRGANVTQQLLAFSRRVPIMAEPVDVSSAVTDLGPLLERLLGGMVKVRAEVAPELPVVWMDRGQLAQVIINLAVNARDAMPDGGTLVIRTFGVPAAGGRRPVDAPPGEWVCLEVEDDGVGIPRDVLERIFEPYFTTKEVGRGTGLGLAVVYGAVERAGGHTTVQSAVGQGATFRVFLPPHREGADDERTAVRRVTPSGLAARTA